MIKVNAMGDACPIPVVKTKNAIKEMREGGTVEVSVDNTIAVQNLTKMAKQFGKEEGGPPWQSKSYDILLERIHSNRIWQFRLTANPTKSVKSAENKKRGVVHAHITPEHQTQWLLDRCEAHGFSVDPEEVVVISSQWQRFYKGSERKHPVTLLSVTFDGILTVTDEVSFRQTLVEGIGRGKAFGQGMLTVMGLGNAHG